MRSLMSVHAAMQLRYNHGQHQARSFGQRLAGLGSLPGGVGNICAAPGAALLAARQVSAAGELVVRSKVSVAQRL